MSHSNLSDAPGMVASETSGWRGASESDHADIDCSGSLIINADDWGRDQETTDRIVECVGHGAISSVSAMVFMEGSERAAAIARESGIDAGLHLNVTTPFSGSNTSKHLSDQQRRISHYLRRHRLAQIIYNPALRTAFEYVVAAQVAEFRRLYGREPERLDGHHHMHLCANVLFAHLLPVGTVVRRNFTFHAGERSAANQLYRRTVDRFLARRHRLTDFLFSLSPLEPASRLLRIVSLARTQVVEVETHPVNDAEREFLTSGQIRRLSRDLAIAPAFVLGGRFDPIITRRDS